MVNFDVSDVRRMTLMLAPTADFDSSFTFYYDETNNIRKFYVREIDFFILFYQSLIISWRCLIQFLLTADWIHHSLLTNSSPSTDAKQPLIKPKESLLLLNLPHS